MATQPRKIEISGDHLTIDQVVAVARGGARAELSPDLRVRERITSSRALLDAKLAQGEIIYGVNTGFGYMTTSPQGAANPCLGETI